MLLGQKFDYMTSSTLCLVYLSLTDSTPLLHACLSFIFLRKSILFTGHGQKNIVSRISNAHQNMLIFS